MPRPRKPTQLHALSGALDKNPGRFADRANEPQDDRPLGDPPMHLRPEERAAWAELERISAPGVLCFGDRIIVELTAVHIAMLRGLGAGLPDAKVRRLESLLGQLGLTPAARSKVTARQVRAGNRFAANGQR